MDILTSYLFILIAALWLSCIAVGCLLVDTILSIKRYINERKYINNSGGFIDDEK